MAPLATYLDMDDREFICEEGGLEMEECRAMETNTCLGGERCMYIDPDDVRDRHPASPQRQHRGLNILCCVCNTVMMIVALEFRLRSYGDIKQARTIMMPCRVKAISTCAAIPHVYFPNRARIEEFGVCYGNSLAVGRTPVAYT
jgi:hypothetical protein